MTRRVRIGAAAGAAVLLLAGALLAVVLNRDPGGASPPPQTLVTTEDLAKLKAEAEAAARNFVKTVDRADATGNEKLLDDLYTEGAANLADGQKQLIRGRTAKGEVSTKATQIDDVAVQEVTTRTARVRIVVTVLHGELREAKTGQITKRVGRSVTPLILGFERIQGRWLVSEVSLDGGS